MVDHELGLLLLTAGSVGVIHALAGPDHYLPFIALARARGWSTAQTARVTLLCGSGHVLASLLLGGLGIALGWSLGGLEALQSVRGELAAWLLLGFGLAYAAWGLRQALRDRPHSHWHTHADGTVHDHSHVHRAAHAHPHDAVAGRALTPWLLFVIFVLGPCEALIPLLMAAGARGSWSGVALVAAVFALATLVTMLAAVLAGILGLARVDFRPAQRYAHAVAGLAIAACGAAIWLGL